MIRSERFGEKGGGGLVSTSPHSVGVGGGWVELTARGREFVLRRRYDDSISCCRGNI